MENRIPDDKTWNVAPADIPQKTRFQPALMSLALDLVVNSVRAGCDGHRGGDLSGRS